MEENNKILDGLCQDISEIKTLLRIFASQRMRGEAKMTQREYAEYRGVTPNTIIEQMKKRLYDTPQGYTEPCYDNTGKRGSAMFVRELADLYYTINIKACPEASDIMAEHTL